MINGRFARAARRAVVLATAAVVSLAPAGQSGPTGGGPDGPRRGWTRLALGRFLHERWSLSVYTIESDDGTWYCSDWSGARPGYGCTLVDGPIRSTFVSTGYSWGHNGDMVMLDGEVSREVKSLAFKIRNGPDYPVTIIKPPEELDFPWNYYIGFLPIELRGSKVARDRAGDIVDTEALYSGPKPGSDVQQTEWRSERRS